MSAPTRVQLTGGNFQDAEGNVLANGTLRMELVQDEQLSSDTGQVCSGITVHITLDDTGNVNASPAQSVWPTDVMTPAGASYTVWGYSAEGQLVWGPNYGLLVPSGATFDTGTWIPNTTGGGSGSSGGGITLQTNEVNNGSQQLLDLHAGSGITLTDNGSGRVTIAGGGAAGSLFYGGQSINPGMFQGASDITVQSTAGLLGVARVVIPFSITVSQLAVNFANFPNIPNIQCMFGLYSADGNTLIIDCGQGFTTLVNLSGTPLVLTLASPVLVPAGEYLFVYGSTTSAFTCQANFGHDVDSFIFAALNLGNTFFMGTAANSPTGAAGNQRLPATLGALTRATSPQGLPGCAFMA